MKTEPTKSARIARFTVLLQQSAVLALCVIFLAVGQAKANTVIGSITHVDGKVFFSKPGPTTWKALKPQQTLKEGYRLQTKADSRLEARLKDGSIIRLGANSELRLTNISFKKTKKKESRSITMGLSAGKVWTAIKGILGSDSDFKVKTPHAVAGARGTRYNTATGEDGTTVKVYSGKVLVSNKPIYAVKGHTKKERVQVAGPQLITKEKWKKLIASAMQYIQVASDGAMSSPASFELADASQDAWEAWNLERDAAAGIQK